MAMLLGVDILLVDVRDGGDHRGVTTCVYPEGRKGLVQRALVILAGALQQFSADELEWPPNPGLSTDTLNLAKVVHELGLNRKQYGDILLYALKMTADNEFWRLMNLVVGSLDYRPVLDERRLRLLAEA